MTLTTPTTDERRELRDTLRTAGYPEDAANAIAFRRPDMAFSPETADGRDEAIDWEAIDLEYRAEQGGPLL